MQQSCVNLRFARTRDIIIDDRWTKPWCGIFLNAELGRRREFRFRDEERIFNDLMTHLWCKWHSTAVNDLHDGRIANEYASKIYPYCIWPMTYIFFERRVRETQRIRLRDEEVGEKHSGTSHPSTLLSYALGRACHLPLLYSHIFLLRKPTFNLQLSTFNHCAVTSFYLELAITK